MSEMILIVDDELSNASIRAGLQNKLQYTIARVSSGDAAIRWLSEERAPKPDMVVVDMSALGEKGVPTIRGIRASKPQIPVIALIPYGDDMHAGKALQAGATDFLAKPITVDRLRHTVQMAFKLKRMTDYMSWLERRIAGHVDFSDIVGEHPIMLDAKRLAAGATVSKHPVWVEGASGTGKELFARAIHGASPRAAKPFVTVLCDMLAPSKDIALLFGQENGDAVDEQFSLGKLREADGGTLLLKNVDALSPEAQHRLLDYLESGAITPLGSTKAVRPDVRIMCAASAGVTLGNDRLLQRLKASIIALPPLSVRQSDIGKLAEHFIAMHSASEQRYVRGLTVAARQRLLQNPWPGNVRQLGHALWRGVILAAGEWIDVADLEPVLRDPATAGILSNEGRLLTDASGKVKTLKSVQEEAIRYALQYSGGCMTRAAKSLGIGRSTLYRKLGEYQINPHISRANQTTRPMMNVSAADRS